MLSVTTNWGFSSFPGIREGIRHSRRECLGTGRIAGSRDGSIWAKLVRSKSLPSVSRFLDGTVSIALVPRALVKALGYEVQIVGLRYQTRADHQNQIS